MTGSKYGGYGISPHGRSNYGNAASELEPRFFSSNPTDGSVDVSVYATTIVFSVYCFSSTVLDDGQLLVEISENGGTSYADAYRNEAFVAPYAGSRSRIDFQVANPQELMIYVHKSAPWANDKEIRVRVTILDEFGNEATKEAPVVWGA